MSKKPQCNVILLLTEGETDISTLAPALTSYFASRNGRFASAEPFRCDVTALRLFPDSARNSGILPPYDDAKQIVDSFVRRHVRESSFSPREYMQIVQLIDLDGAFIPADSVIEQTNLQRLEYKDNHILAPDRRWLITVHDEKKRQVHALLSKHHIALSRGITVPYQLFFMSRNLEHALSGVNGNLDGEQKADIAAVRGLAYGQNPNLLMNDLLRLYAMNIPQGRSAPNLKETWDWAMTGVHSLERNSNLILLPKLIRMRRQELCS